MKTYIVTAKLVHPSCYHSGYEFEVHAKTKADAIKSARNMVWREGHTRQDGGLRYSASEAE